MKNLPGIIAIVIVIMAFLGWFMNLGKFFNCDFESPYKCEVVRSLGIVFPPVGAVAGWISIDP